MEMLHVWGICNLTATSYVKVREKHDGATGFLWNQLPSSKKALKVRPKWRGYPALPWESTSTSKKTLHAKIGSKYISRVAVFSVLESPNKVAALSMYLLPIFAWRVCFDVEVDSQDSVGYPLHYGLNLRAFFWVWELISKKTSGTIVFLANFYMRIKSQIANSSHMQHLHSLGNSLIGDSSYLIN